ncbi:MAG: DegV family EDD domain-containing protein [Oscillospiraceae bacterium]|nr:DegV family EDD domain-containing protein [Oscillospiraceae bacterium]
MICITLGSGISNSFQNLKALSERVEGIYPIDSGNLSTATGLLVIEAARYIEQGLSAEEVCEKVLEIKSHSHASFILDTLEFLKAGGRCSALAAFGASLFSLKVSIEVNNADASMSPGKKYRGGLSKVMPEYIKDQLFKYKNIRKDRIFFTHSGLPQELVDLGVKTIKELADPEEICVTRASCTISSHCGPNCFGVLFIDED